MSAAVDDCRGLDHGTRVLLLKVYPDVDLPVVQMSVQPALGTGHHLHIGAALRSLREQDGFIVGSGHLTYNLRDWSMNANTTSRLDYATAPHTQRAFTLALKAWHWQWMLIVLTSVVCVNQNAGSNVKY
jgi:4,5-DOPA dioxygenase extradiol